MAKKAFDLRALALNITQSFRTKSVHVPEWGIDVFIREPSSKAWLEWQHKLSQKDETLTDAEKARRSMESDVILFVDVLLDENKHPVFTDADRDEILRVYGPVHGRLLRQALDMSMSSDEAGKKSESQQPSS